MNKLSTIVITIPIDIGGVYAPAKIIQTACGIVGLNVNKIWFDYNYVVRNAGIQ